MSILSFRRNGPRVMNKHHNGFFSFPATAISMLQWQSQNRLFIKQQPVAKQIIHPSIYLTLTVTMMIQNVPTLRIAPTFGIAKQHSQSSLSYSAHDDELLDDALLEEGNSSQDLDKFGQPQAVPPKKSVRFHERVHKFRRCPRFVKDQVTTDKLWYNNQDFTEFRANFKRDSKLQIRTAKMAGKSLDCYKQAFFMCQNGIETLDREIAQPLECFLARPERIGLERVSCLEVYNDKKERKKLLSESMQALQSHTCLAACSPSEKQDFISMACQEISRPSVLFAYQVALAAAACVEEP